METDEVSQLEGTAYAWKQAVENKYFNPPEGLCVNVLYTAARHGDPTLATAAFRALGGRGEHYEKHHYEALHEAYLADQDLESAFAVFCIMEDVGFKLGDASTRPMLHLLRTHDHLVPQAFSALMKLRSRERNIPTALVNCIIENQVAKPELQRAIKVYKGLAKLCPAGPNTTTFDHLLRGCVSARDQQNGMFFAAEMLALKIKPSASTYKYLIQLCLQSSDYENSFRYLTEMKVSGFKPGLEIYEAVIEKCAKFKDGRVQVLLGEMEDAGMETQRITTTVKWFWPEYGKFERDVEESEVRSGSRLDLAMS